MLKAEADCLWNMTEGAMTFKDDEPMSWALFVDAFYDRHFPQTVQEQKKAEFMQLVQGIMKAGAEGGGVKGGAAPLTFSKILYVLVVNY